MAENKKNRVQSLETFRLIAALIVLLSHSAALKTDNLYRFFNNGNFAIIFFFMLSGWGMIYHYHKEKNENLIELGKQYSLRRGYLFAFNRIKRLYFWYILFIVLALPSNFYDYREWHGTLYAFGYIVLTVLLTPTCLQSLFGVYQASHLGLAAYWFISSIFIIYIFFPLIYKCFFKIKKFGNIVKCISILIMYGITVFIWSILHFLSLNTFFNSLDYSFPLNGMLYFILGMLSCDFYLSSKDKIKSTTIIEICMLIALIVWLLGRNSFFVLPDILKHALDIGIWLMILIVFSYEAGKLSKLIGGVKIDYLYV